MRNSIYQDLKYNSNGEAFYCHENFEKDFLELVRLEKNLTGRDFDLSQRQFSVCKSNFIYKGGLSDRGQNDYDHVP